MQHSSRVPRGGARLGASCAARQSCRPLRSPANLACAPWVCCSVPRRSKLRLCFIVELFVLLGFAYNTIIMLVAMFANVSGIEVRLLWGACCGGVRVLM